MKSSLFRVLGLTCSDQQIRRKPSKQRRVCELECATRQSTDRSTARLATSNKDVPSVMDVSEAEPER